MDLNDKIAARRREVERAREQAQADELARQKAEFARQVEERRVAEQQARQEEAAEVSQLRESFIQRGYSASGNASKTVDIELETALIGESIERVTKVELAVFIVLAVISIGNLVVGQYLHAMGWGVAALAHISYVVRKHRRAVLTAPPHTTEEVPSDRKAL